MNRLVLLLLIALVACNQQDAQTKHTPLNASKHSAGLNQAISSSLDIYNSLSEAFVNWDSVKVNSIAEQLKAALDSVQSQGAADSLAQSGTAMKAMEAARQHLHGIVAASSLFAKRQAFNAFTEQYYGFLDQIRYDRQVLYLQQCPMAFNDTGKGVWISRADSIRNPYLGLHHPTYHAGMIQCGENKSQLNYTGNK